MMGPMVLPADIQIVPLTELPPQVRSQIQGDDADFALTRPRSRTPSKVVDASSRDLIEQFREPSTIVDALVRYSKTLHVKPTDLLEDAYPLIQSLLAAKLLVEPGADGEAIVPTLEPGARFAEWEVEATIQVLIDSELHRVTNASGQRAALKLLREAAPRHVRRAFVHEAAILRLLGEGIAPKLIEAGDSHVITEWCEGANASEAAAGRPEVCVAIADAYARLHAAGVLHGDVHPGNVLVNAADGAVRLIDFGLARRVDGKAGTSPARGGVAFFSDPEMAGAGRRGVPPPHVTALSEQYSLAALLYFLLAGRHYLDFSVEREEMLRQITEDAPARLPGPAGLVLERALSKKPEGRYPSMAEFAAAFGAAMALPAAPAAPERLREYVDAFVSRFDDPHHPPEYQGPEAPTASVTYGAAGVAYALLRVAQAREDPAVLALADRWADRAAALDSEPAAYYHEAVQITPEIVGRVSPYHTASGGAMVSALTAHAFGDLFGFERAVDRFLAASSQPCENLDLTLGRSGSVIAASLLLDAWRAVSTEPAEGLVEFGNRTLAGVWDELAQLPPIQAERKIGYLGMAHGWAGFAYAALRWRKSAGGQLPPGVEARLAELAQCAQPTRHGVRWPYRLHARDAFVMSGWCNGGAGQVFLWNLAAELLGDPAHAKLAEATALDVFHTPMQIDTLCCGLAGAAYAQLAVYKRTGETVWLDRARTLTNRALQTVSPGEGLPHSLYKGQVGVAVLAAELSQPEFASMPMFEERRWPRKTKL